MEYCITLLHSVVTCTPPHCSFYICDFQCVIVVLGTHVRIVLCLHVCVQKDMNVHVVHNRQSVSFVTAIFTS